MRGRDKFKMTRPIFRIVGLLCSLLPGWIFRGTWIWLDLLPGVLGVATRYVYAKRLCASLGDSVLFGRGVEIRCWERLRVGGNVSIHSNCYLDATGGISIGDEVSVAHQCSIVSFNHGWQDESMPIRQNPCLSSEISIGRDVWIGCGVRILSGASIEDRTVVAAGAVVVSSLAGGALYGGVPAKKLKEIIR